MSVILPLSVLLVDNEYTQRRWLRGIIEDTLPNVDIIEATSVAEVDENLPRWPRCFAAVVDFHLTDPLRDGLNVLALLEEKWPGCYRILVSRIPNEDELKKLGPADTAISIHFSRSTREPLVAQALREAVRQHWERNPAVAVV